MRRSAKCWLAAFLLALAAACGDSSGPTSDGPTAEVRERLLAFADAAARQNGSSAERVEAVESTREAANDAIGAEVSGQEAVWVMQIEAKQGEEFQGIRGPAGGRYIWTVVRQSDYEGTDGGLTGKPANLSTLGEVVVLRG